MESKSIFDVSVLDIQNGIYTIDIIGNNLLLKHKIIILR